MNGALPSAPVAAPSSVLEQLLEGALQRADSEATIVGVELPAPSVAAEYVVAGASDDALVFAPPAGFESAGLGVCAVISGSGPERFAQVESKARALFARLSVQGASAPPRLFGGFAFQSGRAQSTLWRALGEARFVLPRLLYSRDEGQATLSVYARREELEQPSSRRALALEAEQLLSALRSQAGVTAAPEIGSWPPSPGAELGREGAEEWSRLVEEIRARIARGELEKVVLARRVELALARAPDPADVLARLRVQAPECSRFMLSCAGQVFLGAAPERLIKRRGDAFETEAVAGSMKAEEPTPGARLLESDKDLMEHQMVVRGIVEALAPIASELTHPRRPELHRLRHVLHLRTPIRGRLLGGDHVLSLVSRLHPTPAVGGLPSAAALDWIAAHERDERGWYAGPFGWFDAAGDGEFVVALRSGLLAGDRAELYVGAGIVQGSSPLEEFAETQWKLAALAGALGVKP